MQTLNQIIFLYPYFLLLLPLYFICEKYCKKQIPTTYFPNLKLLKIATSKNTISSKILKYIILFFIVLSLSSPIIKKELELNNSKGYEISLVLDSSGSMYEDNRFDITKKILTNFINKRKTDRLALTVFADFAYTAVPLTYDKQSLLSLLKYIKIGVAGTRDTALYEALYLSSDLFVKSKTKNKIIILLTDGLNTIKSIPLEIAIAKVKKYGIKVYTIGIGNKNDYNKNILNKISLKTGGKFFETSDPTKLENIYKEIDNLEKSKIKTIKYIHKKYLFQYPLFIACIFLIILIIVSFKKNKNINKSFIYLIISFIFILISLYRPSVQGKVIKTSQNNLKVMVAFDISKSMQCKDIYPSRLQFAQNKFNTLLDNLQNEKIGIVGFSNQSYIIAPITNDYNALKFLVKKLNLNNIDKKGSNILDVIKTSNKLLNSDDKKALIIFTDGTEKNDFSKEIRYAKEHNITIFIYNIGSKKGGVLYNKKDILKDKDGNIVITKLNENIKSLATDTNGIYIKYSLNNNDIKIFAEKIKEEFNSKKLSENKIRNNTELFIIPLFFAFIFFLLSTIQFRGKKL